MGLTHYSLSGTITGIGADRYIYANPIFGSAVNSILVNQPLSAVSPGEYQSAIEDCFTLFPDYTNVVVIVTDNHDTTYSISIECDHDNSDLLYFPVGINIYAAEDYFSPYGNFFIPFTYPFSDPCPECEECQEPVEGCKECFAAKIAECNDITLDLGLTPDEVYTWDILYLALNLRYQGTATADSGGKIVINQVDLPTGLLSPYSGSFKLQLLDDEGAPLSFSIGGTLYSCINLSVHAGDGIAIIPNPGASASVFNGDDEPFLQVD